jgi:hypothetical protein
MRRTVLAVLMTLLLPSCIDDFEQAAVTASPLGGLRVLFYHCHSHRPATDAETIQLLVTENDNHPGDDDNTVLWEVTAGERAQVSGVVTFEPGSVPSGY